MVCISVQVHHQTNTPAPDNEDTLQALLEKILPLIENPFQDPKEYSRFTLFQASMDVSKAL